MVSSSFLWGKLLRSVLHLFHHAMCPKRDRRLDWTTAERWGCLVNLLTSSLRTCWCQVNAGLFYYANVVCDVLIDSLFYIAASGWICTILVTIVRYIDTYTMFKKS